MVPSAGVLCLNVFVLVVNGAFAFSWPAASTEKMCSDSSMGGCEGSKLSSWVLSSWPGPVLNSTINLFIGFEAMGALVSSSLNFLNLGQVISGR